MAFSPTLSHVVLVITAGVLFYVALTDLKEFKIRNELILVLVGLFILHAFFSGRWVTLHWNLVIAALMFAIMLYFYAQNWMGGGDVKILTVGFLWVGISCALVFAILLAVFAMMHAAAAKFGWVKVQQVGVHKRIPLAPSVAAALIGCFMLGCLQPVSLLTQLSFAGSCAGRENCAVVDTQFPISVVGANFHSAFGKFEPPTGFLVRKTFSNQSNDLPFSGRPRSANRRTGGLRPFSEGRVG